MKLYEINAEYQELIDLAMSAAEESETGEIPTALADQLDKIEIERNIKIENCACVYKQAIAMAEVIKSEEDALRARRKRQDRLADWMKEYIFVNVEQGEKIETARVKISWRKSESVEIRNETELPSKYVHIVTEIKPDKSAIKEAIKSGELIGGAELVTRNNIQIK